MLGVGTVTRLLSPLIPYLFAAAVLAAGGGVWYVMDLRADKAALVAENGSLSRSLAAIEAQAEQSRLAREVEAARAERFAVRSAKLSATIEALLTGEIPDEMLDPRIADYINGLRETD
jgi:cell division protein FtsB